MNWTYKVLGLDISTKLGWALLTWNTKMGWKHDQGEFSAGSMERTDRWKEFDAWADMISKPVADGIKFGTRTMVVIENYGFANAFTLVPLVEIGTVVRRRLQENGLTWLEIPPTVLKKFATGKGSSKKDEIMLAVYKNWAITPKTNNEADALVLAYLGMAHMGIEYHEWVLRSKFTTEQRDILMKIIHEKAKAKS